MAGPGKWHYTDRDYYGNKTIFYKNSDYEPANGYTEFERELGIEEKKVVCEDVKRKMINEISYMIVHQNNGKPVGAAYILDLFRSYFKFDYKEYGFKSPEDFFDYLGYKTIMRVNRESSSSKPMLFVTMG